MKFKHLKLFGACSAATLLFCFDADGINMHNFLKGAATRAERTGDPQLMRAVQRSQGGDAIIADLRNPSNNTQNKSNSRKTKTSAQPKNNANNSQTSTNLNNPLKVQNSNNLRINDNKNKNNTGNNASSSKPSNNAQNKSSSKKTKTSAQPKNNANNSQTSTNLNNPLKVQNSNNLRINDNKNKNNIGNNASSSKPSNNAQNKSNSERKKPSANSKKEDARRSTFKKIGKSSKVSEQEFSQWIGAFEEGLIAPEELHFFQNSADYICQLIEQGSTIQRNGKNYGNQCSILALNLDENTMLKIYDEMDKFDDYGHNFANHVNRSGGLSDGDQKTWSRISDIIKYRVAIYTRHHSDPLVCTVYGENKKLPVKRIYLKPNHYQELLINKNLKAKNSQQKPSEEKSRETETPKQEKRKTVEDVRKEFIEVINAKKKPGEKKIDTLRNIFENSGLTDNEELKRDMVLLDVFFDRPLDRFNSDRTEANERMRNVHQMCVKYYEDENFEQLKVFSNQGMAELSRSVSEELEKAKESLNKSEKQIDAWRRLIERSKNASLALSLKSKLGHRRSVIKDQYGQIGKYRGILESIKGAAIDYCKPTLKQAKKFTKAECEKAIKDGVIKPESFKLGDESAYFRFVDAVESNDGNVMKAERVLYKECLKDLWEICGIRVCNSRGMEVLDEDGNFVYRDELLRNRYVQEDIIRKVKETFADLSNIENESFVRVLSGAGIPSSWFKNREDLKSFYKIIVDRVWLSAKDRGDFDEYKKYWALADEKETAKDIDFSSALRTLVISNGQLFRDPDFVRGLKGAFREVEEASKDSSTYTDEVKAMFEVISRL